MSTLSGSHERLSDLPSERQAEGVRHRTADQDRVRLVEQPIDYLDLVAHLGAAEDDHKGPRRILQFVVQISQFLFHEEASDRGADVMRDALGRGVSAMRGTEGIVHVDVAELRERLRKPRVIGFLLGLKADVFEQRHVAVVHVRDDLLRHVADSVVAEGDGLANERVQVICHGPQRLLLVRFPFGRPRWLQRITFAPRSTR